jgi:hypothetical protein
LHNKENNSISYGKRCAKGQRSKVREDFVPWKFFKKYSNFILKKRVKIRNLYIVLMRKTWSNTRQGTDIEKAAG